ncbi:transglycosylase family protein [Streptomyces sodiiphilus]|uniref:transglycosylase family protein n=1 Tax=Streptomyces sodiiphilus TaxID=226217 RepID=UPI0031E47708
MAARGRHRRYKPSPVSRASLTVTAGGAGLALPLISAAPANAAPVETWDKVAECESNGTWDINTGNGYFGGLQFKQSTWEEFGGTAYAARADQASKDQQIAVAEQVLEGQGPRAWPTCSQRAGLVRGGEAPDVSPQGTRAEPAAAQEGKDGAAPSYEVVRGDTLSGIAQSHGVRGGWQSLYELNRQTVGSDPDLIIPGQRLALESGSPTARTPAPQKSAGKPEKARQKAQEKTEKAQQKQQAEQKQAEKKKKKEESGARQAAAPAYVSPVSGGTGTAYRTTGSSWSSGYHTGVDFPVPTGTAVKSVTAGQVVSAGWADSFGYEVIVRHPDGRYTQYAHLSAISVSAGQPVAGGQQVGRVGSTGNSTGPHLHFEVRTGPGFGSDIDPLAYLRQNGVTL